MRMIAAAGILGFVLVLFAGPAAPMALGQTAGGDRWGKSGRGDEGFLGHARYFLTQRLDHKLTGGKHSTYEGYLKAFLLHFQFANYGFRCFAKLSSSFP